MESIPDNGQQPPFRRPHNFNDLTGQRFGRLLVLSYTGRSNNHREAIWVCECDCGVVKEIVAYELRRGSTQSCGCYRLDRISKPPGEAAFNRLIKSYRIGALSRGLEWALGIDRCRELFLSACFYCGSPPSQPWYSSTARRKKGLPIIYTGIDRLDNAHGYVEGNVVPCCKRCNFAKAGMTVEEFLAWARRLGFYQLLKGHG